MAPSTLITPGGVITASANQFYASVEGLLGRPLTARERAAVQARLTGYSTIGVMPGDLITADLFNTMRADINALAERVAALEGGTGGPWIESIAPKNGVKVNSMINIYGRNFDREPRRNKVFIDGIEVPGIRQESTETQLIVPVPDAFEPLPKSVDVVVQLPDGRRSNSVVIRIEPMPNGGQVGELKFGSAIVPNGKIFAGQTFNLSWEVEASTTRSDNFDLALAFTQATGAKPEAWSTKAEFLTPNPQQIDPGEKAVVTARIVVPDGAKKVSITAAGTSRLNPTVGGFTAPVDIVVGETPEASDNRIALTFTPNPLGGPITIGKVKIGDREQNGLLVQKGQAGEFFINAKDTRPGGGNAAFTIKAEVVQSPGNWSVKDIQPSQQDAIPPGQDVDVTVTLSNESGDIGSTGVLRIDVNQTVNTGDLARYKAFISIPLRIVA